MVWPLSQFHVFWVIATVTPIPISRVIKKNYPLWQTTAKFQCLNSRNLFLIYGTVFSSMVMIRWFSWGLSLKKWLRLPGCFLVDMPSPKDLESFVSSFVGECFQEKAWFEGADLHMDLITCANIPLARTHLSHLTQLQEELVNLVKLCTQEEKETEGTAVHCLSPPFWHCTTCSAILN